MMLGNWLMLYSICSLGVAAPIEQSLKRYMTSGSLCPIGFHLIIGCHDGALRAIEGLHFSISPSAGGVEGYLGVLRAV